MTTETERLGLGIMSPISPINSPATDTTAVDRLEDISSKPCHRRRSTQGTCGNSVSECGSDTLSPKAAIFSGCKKLEEQEASLDQGSTLIKIMVDYMHALEVRIDQLEMGTGPSRQASKKTCSNAGTFNSYEDDTAVQVDVQFFYAGCHAAEDFMYVDVHGDIDPGSFPCVRSPRHLIRVLYAGGSGGGGSKQLAATAAPEPSDADILTFGVDSKPLCAWFEKLLDTPLETGGRIRFEKPFKAVLRCHDRVCDQLAKLEAKAGAGRAPDPDTEEYDTPAALPHFRAYVEFVNKYLAKPLELFRRLRSGPHGHDRVTFENLWMLFDTGDTVYCPLRKCKNGTKPLQNSEGEGHLPVRRHTSQAYRVVCTSGGSPYFGRLMKTRPAGLEGTRKAQNSYSKLHVYAYYVDFNGFTYGMVREVFVFRPFEGEVDIRSVLVYPVQYVTDTRLLERGTKFLQLTEVCHQQYEGLTAGPNREEINSSVMVDMKLAFENNQDMEKAQLEAPTFTFPSTLWLGNESDCTRDVLGKAKCGHPWCYDHDCNENIYLDVQKKLRGTIESEIKLVLEDNDTVRRRRNEGQELFQKRMKDKDLTQLLPGAVPGFALRNRRWVLLDIKRLRDVEYIDEWKNLVLPDGYQDMVQAMVETHAQDGNSSSGKHVGMDLVQGKGRGCIILLHGVPGVGKTSTAECVAAHTRRPLYPITCGDIGCNAEEVERNLETHFKLAHRWGCVLLLDEADVFLARRDQRDVQRNGLVSVFLRILEYYPGILFLTTNRVGVIDDAFRSRLHLTLYYPKLKKDQAVQIFHHNFKRIANINKERKASGLLPFDYKLEKDEIIKWVKSYYSTLQWNGRQIRNAFQTVLALAEFNASTARSKPDSPSSNEDTDPEKPAVKLRHFKTVGLAALQFNEYLMQTHGYDEERVAKRETIRTDTFKFKSPFSVNEDSDDPGKDSEEEEEDKTKKKVSKKADKKTKTQKTGKKVKGKAAEMESEPESE